MTFTENGRKLVLEMISASEGAEAVLFATDEIDGGLSLGMHIVDLQEGDRVIEFGDLKVVISEELEEMLGDVIFDEQDGELVVAEEGCGGDCDCGGSCGDGEESGCGGSCGCGH